MLGLSNQHVFEIDSTSNQWISYAIRQSGLVACFAVYKLDEFGIKTEVKTVNE